MERISIFNYEAFYLDYLEGNLNEGDTALLMEFLDKHPELRMEDEILPSFETSIPSLDPQFKSTLKQTDHLGDMITEENAESFIIAETEGLLSPDRSNDLNDLLKERKDLQELRRLYAATRLKPDHTISYADKAGLKRKAPIVLWPYISFAAAASVAAFFFFVQGPDSDPFKQVNGGLAGGARFEVNNSGTSVTNAAAVNSTYSGHSNHNEANNHNHGSVEIANHRPSLNFTVVGLNKKEAETFQLDPYDREVIENTIAQSTYEQRHENADYAMLGIDDMNNPIKPVTNRLSNAIKQEVDFRTAKASTKNSGGFYVKIGKFELSHKKH